MSKTSLNRTADFESLQGGGKNFNLKLFRSLVWDSFQSKSEPEVEFAVCSEKADEYISLCFIDGRL